MMGGPSEADRILSAFLKPAEIVREFRRLLSRTTNLAENDADLYGDGDQSFVGEVKGKSLQEAWVSAADFSFATSRESREWNLDWGFCTPFMLDCVLGAVEPVEAAIAKAKAKGGDELMHLLERREFVIRMSPLLGCIAGSRILGYGYFNPSDEKQADHLAVARALLDAGANLRARDVAGHTALHHATSYRATAVTLRIAAELLRRGVDLEARTRLGRLPIFDSLSGGSIAVTRLLPEAGVDPGARSAEGTVVFNCMPPAVLAIMQECAARGRVGAGKTLEGERVVLSKLKTAELNGKVAECGEYDPIADRYAVTLPDGRTVAVKRVNVKGEEHAAEKAAAGAFKLKCWTCDEPATLLCTGCANVGFCSQECGRAAWRGRHKKPCKRYRAEHVVELPLDALSKGMPGAAITTTIPMPWAVAGAGTGVARAGAENAAGSGGATPYIVLKAQMPIITPPTLEQINALGGAEAAAAAEAADEAAAPAVYIYNEDRSLEYYIPGDLPGYAKIRAAVRGKGLAGLKVYISQGHKNA